MSKDTRIKVTRTLLNQALIDLLETKSINKITIKEICEKADVNRSTYYHHFKDIYEQFDYIKENFCKATEKYIGSLDKVGHQLSLYERTLLICTFVLKERKTFLAIINTSTLNGAIEFYTNYYEQSVIQQWQDDYDIDTKLDNYILNYLYAGFLKITYDWLNQYEIKETPEEIAKLTTHLYVSTLQSLQKHLD